MKRAAFRERFLCWATPGATACTGTAIEGIATMRHHEKTHAALNTFFGIGSYIVHVVVVLEKSVVISSRCMRSTRGSFRSAVAHLVNLVYDLAHEIFGNDLASFKRELRGIPREMLPPHTIGGDNGIDEDRLKDGIDDAVSIARRMAGVDFQANNFRFKDGNARDAVWWLSSM